MIIYTESDYLEAHLTEISSGSQGGPIHIETVPERLTSVLKRFTSSSPDSSSPKSSRPSKSRNH